MKLLAIDTATTLCSVALYIDGDIRERTANEPRAHADNVLPMVSDLLARAELALTQLDGIAFGRGPGGFTGLRVAAAVTQGLAFGADLPVVGISDLAALAFAAHETHGWRDIAAALDARMGEIYYGVYRASTAGAEPIVADTLAAPDKVTVPDTVSNAAGAGWQAHWTALPESVRQRCRQQDPKPPQARTVAALGQLEITAGRGGAPETAVPVYLRDKVANKRR